MGEKPGQDDEAAGAAGGAAALKADPRGGGGGGGGGQASEQKTDPRGGGGGKGEPADAINLNSSKSNAYREAGPGAGGDVEDPTPVESASVKSAKSNSSERVSETPQGGAAGEPDESINLNSSRSN